MFDQFSFFVQTGWTIAVDVVIGPKDGISYRAERGSLVSTCLLSCKELLLTI